MKDIKTKEIKKDIKTLDKSRAISERMKNAAFRTKVESNQEVAENENSPNEYASDCTEQAFVRVKDKTFYELNKQGQKGLEETKQNISKTRDYFRNQKNNGYINSEPQSSSGAKSTENQGSKLIKQPSRSAGRMTAKTAEKHTIKTTQKSVKTAEKTSKEAIKKSGKAVQKTAQATAKASQKAAQTTRAAAKATVTTLKAAAKATVAAVKAIITGTKALVAAIAAGGWVAIVVIVVICFIALIVGSCFGLFFSGEDSGTGQTIQTAVQEINSEYQAKLDEIKAPHTYDVLEMSGDRAAWKEVLAVYAVMVATDYDNPQEVITVNDSKKETLKNIFWDMNEISSRTQLKTETVIEPADDGHGNIVEMEKTVTRTYLYINMSHITAEEMADQYNFNANQRNQLFELLSDDNNSMWGIILDDISYSDE